MAMVMAPDSLMGARTGSYNGGSSMAAILIQELADLDGVQSQNPETGAGIDSTSVYISDYTNYIFGAPFQLIDTVDRRFPEVNSSVGVEYLRNFILNAPILRLKPGMPLYTGNADGKSLLEAIRTVYITSQGDSHDMSLADSILEESAKDIVFSSGSRLQRRMFGFREDYWNYMSYVNYMCRSMAVLMDLTSGQTNRFPTGTYVGSRYIDFDSANWMYYRMLKSTSVTTPKEQMGRMMGATVVGALGQSVSDIWNGMISGSSWNSIASKVTDRLTASANTDVIDVIEDKVCSVNFMVDPVAFNERLTNQVKESSLESKIDQAYEMGTEVQWMTQSNIAPETIENILGALGNTTTAIAKNLTAGIGNIGGFATNLLTGAVQAIQGQKMIYPRIYDKSESQTNYDFTIHLTSPYGDPYNYYMNIVVPLMHLIALAAPRMVTSNSVSSPFLVQAYIPGMCSCGLGIISDMEIIKNPNQNHVSVNGYPLDIDVKITVTELYNALSISPANDPASFLFNESLSDYMANLAGLMPSVDTYRRQRQHAFYALQLYFQNGEVQQDIANRSLQKWENAMMPNSVY